MKPHDWFLEHRVDYATRTLDPEDTTTFDAHLGQCVECREEVAAIGRDLRWLPMGLAPVAPRPGFRRRVVEGVLERRPSRRVRRPRWALPAALAASVLLAIGGWYAGTSRAGALRLEIANQRAAVAALRDTLSIMRAGRILQADVPVGETRGGLVIFADEVTHRWNVVVHGLPAPAPGHRYQFWFICEGGMVRGSEVAGGALRTTMFTTGMPEPSSCPVVKGAALTEEPAAGGEGPPRGRSLVHLML